MAPVSFIWFHNDRLNERFYRITLGTWQIRYLLLITFRHWVECVSVFVISVSLFSIRVSDPSSKFQIKILTGNPKVCLALGHLTTWKWNWVIINNIINGFIFNQSYHSSQRSNARIILGFHWYISFFLLPEMLIEFRPYLSLSYRHTYVWSLYKKKV